MFGNIAFVVAFMVPFLCLGGELENREKSAEDFFVFLLEEEGICLRAESKDRQESNAGTIC